MSHVAEAIPRRSRRAEKFDSLTRSSGIESNEMLHRSHSSNRPWEKQFSVIIEAMKCQWVRRQPALLLPV
jgi:hypothetical protein